MSSAPARSLQTEILDHLQGWAKTLGEILALPEGQNFALLLQAPAEMSAAADTDFWVLVTFSGALQGQLAFRFTAAGVQQLAGEQGETGQPVRAQDQSVVLEIFRKPAARFRPPSEHDEQLQVQAETRVAPSWLDSRLCWLKANLATPLVIEICVSPELIACLQRGQARPAASSFMPDAIPSKLGMLLDVELVVTMRFGGRRMLLKDILDLSTGSVVELDQQVQEPVDLLLDGKLITRGEVVVVDGKYGLRVTKVFSKAEQ